MINLELDIQEVEALLKHIEQSTKYLITKVHSQATAQMALQQKIAEMPEVKED